MFFFATLLWTFAGWCAWVGEARIERSRRLFWCSCAFALFILTKPRRRFVWQGIGLGLVCGMHGGRLRLAAESRRLACWRSSTLFVAAKEARCMAILHCGLSITQLDTPMKANKGRDSAIWSRGGLHARARQLLHKATWKSFEFLERPWR